MIDVDLVLIHGFWSSPKTWDKLTRCFETDDELDGIRVHGFSYLSPKLPPLPLSRTRIPDYNDIAQSLRPFLRTKKERTHTAIVTHSQGGLILQRYLAWMLDEKHGHELAEIKLIVMLACPNEGSEYLRSFRKMAGFGRHPQARDLVALSADVADTRRKVGDRVDRADEVNDYECPIPIYVYSGVSDRIVRRVAAQSFFRNVGSLPGNHSSILNPSTSGNITFSVIKGHLLEEIRQIDGQIERATSRTDRNGSVPQGDLKVPSPAQVRQPYGTGGLKRVTSLFTGRADQIDKIEAAVSAAQEPQDVRAIFVIHGMPGIGKTTLAVHMAHRLVARFSERVGEAGLEMSPRHVDMRGDEGPAQRNPADVLRDYLTNVDEDSRKFSTDIDGLAEQWRHHLAGKFLVLVLDNVSDEDQVLPLLPGGSGHIVLVTSRRPLQRLEHSQDAVRISLPVLSEQESVHLIKTASRRIIKEGDQEPIEGIAGFLGYHPLAIKITSTGLAERPYISFSNRLAQLKAVPDSLLAVDKYADEESGGVARSFELSYRQLTEECQFVLRRLGLTPVPHISVEVAAALADMSSTAAAAQLRRLRVEALVEEDNRGYRLHDLIRRYAKDLTGGDKVENTRAINRVLAYYYTATTYIDSLLTRQPPPPVLKIPPPDMNHHFADRDSAIVWAKEERENFEACADYVASEAGGRDLGQEEARAWTIRFSTALAGLLRNEGLWPRSIELQTRAIVAATQLSEQLAEANARHERGQLYRLSNDLVRAEGDLVKALEIYRGIDGEASEIGEAHVLDTYGVVLDQRDRRAEARNRLDASLARYRRLGDRLGEANALHDRGMLEYFAKDFPEAEDLMGQALRLYQLADHPLGQAHGHSGLAKAQRRLGLGREAAENLKAAEEFYGQLGNLLGDATTRTELGAALRQEGNYDQAEGELRRAVEILEKIGNKLALAKALEELGNLYLVSGDSEKAKSLLIRALEIYRKHKLSRDLTELLKSLRSLGFIAGEDDGGS